MAADSRATVQTEAGGSRVYGCRKLYRKTVVERGRRVPVVIGLAGDVGPALRFVDWYGSGQPPPASFADEAADFDALVMSPRGVFRWDRFCLPEPVLEPFAAIGSGVKAALGAMYAGASAAQAVRIAAQVDPYTDRRVRTMRLHKAAGRPRGKRAARER